MNKALCFLPVMLSLVFLPFGTGALAANPKVVVKMATIAPKGSNFMNTYEEIVRLVKEKTKGEVDIKIYWGGVQGDEKDVFRKIKLGQLHGGGFMGPGLGR